VKARGQSLGRPFKLTPHQRGEAVRRRDRGEPLSDIARSYNVHPSTISRPPALTPAQQKEAARRRAEGATLDELARSYNVGISTIRRATRAA
jgi:hypothetical protein